MHAPKVVRVDFPIRGFKTLVRAEVLVQLINLKAAKVDSGAIFAERANAPSKI